MRVTDAGCWEWTGALYPGGYGMVWGGDKLWRAHRLVYVTHVGPVPGGRDLDHYLWPDGGCVGRACALHTRPASRRENLLRGQGLTARNRAVEECPAGHQYAGANLYVDPDGGRRCRECKRQLDRARYRARKLAA